jgi:dTDP-glucose 4,6-dehydratase
MQAMRAASPVAERIVAVIGSNCFTGSHIVDALLDDSSTRVVAISRSPEYLPLFLPYARHSTERLAFHQIDLVRQFECLTRLLDGVKPSVVINVAALSEVALSHERPLEYFATNTAGVVRLCDHLRRRAYLERYVHVSSAEIFGSCNGPVTEETPFNPSTPYAASKAAADMYIHTLMRHFDFPAVIIRSTNVYGRHQQLFKIIPRTIIYSRLGETIELHGGGRAIKSFIHVRDVVRGLMMALAAGSTGTYHFSVPSSDTVADVVRQVCALTGYDMSRTTQMVGERLGQDARYWLDCSKSARELGWTPQVPFADGVSEVVDWIDAHWDRVRSQPLTYQHKV